MHLRTKRRLISLLAASLFLSAIAVIAEPTFMTPSAESQPTRAAPKAAVEASPVSQSSRTKPRLTAQDFTTHWQKSLRRPLYDPPPPPPPPPKVVEVPPPRPIVAQLVATMIEPGNSMAMLRLSTGEVVFRKMGDEVGAADAGAKISQIEEGYINVDRENKVTKLVVGGQKGK